MVQITDTFKSDFMRNEQFDHHKTNEQKNNKKQKIKEFLDPRVYYQVGWLKTKARHGY